MRLLRLLMVFLVAAPLFAQEEAIVADRPGLADGASVVGRGTVQLETGLLLEDADDSLLALPTLLRIGLAERLELRIESGVVGFIDGDSDWAPVAIGFKWKLIDGEVPLSLIAGVQPPSGGAILGSRETEAGARLVSDIALRDDLTLTPNVGLRLGEGSDPVAIVAATLEKGLSRANVFIDFEVQSGDGDTSMLVDGGVAWLVGNDTQLDVSGGLNAAGDAYPDWFVSAGYSRRF